MSVSHDTLGFLIATGLAIMVLGAVQGTFGWSAFNRVHPWGASRRAGWLIAATGTVLAAGAAAVSAMTS